ncbi:uncharacterized protein EI97DRAFT_313288 [Westerdykella ornata]|uniref:Uncharacterized protein n=1 Tax=Westerdykella ornata TaxID=318751 RepID=A0A6A6JLU2_WESOR|nr:uncharacterized protein EI97DRAFT_313288 [Westerdykella ornata]KAF2277214.1 hypothetical protein EI97DRAFT_313288 [Westerdykella ornata]
MAPAGLARLYAHLPSSPTSRNITYRDLHNHDIKCLASILRDYPIRPDSASSYWVTTKDAIKDLPSHLRSSSLSRLSTSETKDGKTKDGKLCAGHAGLNASLIHSLFFAFRSEIDHGLGAFLYPIFIFAGLPHAQELRFRQIEPISQMWRSDFDIADHTLPGREPLVPTEQLDGGRRVPKWRRQENGCVACILSRLGSDKDVLFALMAGMVGCYSSRVVGKKTSDIKSKRVRFVRYWLKKFGREGEKMAEEAWECGKELRRVRRAWREYARRSGQKGFYGQGSGGLVGMSGSPIHDRSSTQTAAGLHTPTPDDRLPRTGLTAETPQMHTGQSPQHPSSQPGIIAHHPQYRLSPLTPSVHSDTASIPSTTAADVGHTPTFGLNLPRPPLGSRYDSQKQETYPQTQAHPDGLRGMYRAHAPAPLNIRQQRPQGPTSVARDSIYAGFRVDGGGYDSPPGSPLGTPVVPAGPLGVGDEGGNEEGRGRGTMWSDLY